MTTWPATIPTDYSPLTKLTASDLNTVLDALEHMSSAWTTYTPTFEGLTTDPDGTIVGRYKLVGQMLAWQVHATSVAATTAGSGDFLISLPAGVTLTGALQDQVLAAGVDVGHASKTHHGFAIAQNSTRFRIGLAASTGYEYVTGDDPWDPDTDGTDWTEAGNELWIAGVIEVD